MAKIITVPSPILRKKSTPVEKLDKKTLKLISDLKVTLTRQADPEGVGISAPQIGVNKRVFVIKTTNSKQQTTKNYPITQLPNYIIVINPEIIEFSKDTNYDHLKPADRYYEGCLSIPEIYGEVKRPWTIKATYQTPDQITQLRNSTITQLSGFDAIYFQHEYDHLNGILFTDRILEQGGKMFRQNKAGEFEPLQ